MKDKLINFFIKIKNWIVINFANLKMKIKSKVNFKSKDFWFRFFRAILILAAIGFVALIVLFVWYSKDLPSPTKVVRRDGYSSKVYDRNNNPLYDIYDQARRDPVVFSDIPDYLKKATVAVEDKDFYKHNGFDPLTPFRIVKNVFYFGKVTGGSTLTQQLTRNVLLTTERSLTRKIKELILSIQIDAKYSKDEILSMYLNEAPYGGASWGVGPAAEQYFNKPVKELNLAECAILAGLPQLPSVYSPFSKTPVAYINRTNHVLNRMVEDGYISKELATETMEQVKNYKFNDNSSITKAPHFVFWIKELLAEKYGEDVVEGGGLKITTTLDLELQEQAQKIVSEEVDKAENLGISNGAALILDPTNGQVLAMVGSRGYFSDKTDGAFNVTTQALRQPGSAIKPVTYLAGLKKGMTAATMIMDTPVTFAGVGGQKDYSPKNYNGKFNGPMSLRDALGNSINITAVKTLANVGVENMLKLAYDMGMSTLEPTKENLSKFGFAVTLGGAEVKMIELASAYTAFANGGTSMKAIGVLKVEDRNGRVLEEYKVPDGKKVMTPQEAFIISNILSDNSARELTFGAVNGLQVSGYQVAVKTGTTNDKRDNWAIGWTPNLLSAVWVGNNDNSPMGKIASGVSGATPIWKKIMVSSLPKRNKEDFSIPDKIVNLDVDKISGYLAHDGFVSKKEYFIDGTQSSISDPIHMNLKICRGLTGLATPEDVTSGNYDSKEFFNFSESDPVSTDGKNRWQEGINTWISQQSDNGKYFPPTGYCRSGGLIGLSIDSPADRTTTATGNFTARITATSSKKIIEVKLWLDGVEKKTWTEKPYEMELNLEDGKHIIKVKATDKDGNVQEKESLFGVNIPWDATPTPIPSPTNTPENTPIVPISSPTATPSP
ncbi:MAG: PBP1A family penicillin-binding protein [Candidatus Shapirobacteria bacterium]|nr:PBP1A family penicillin-binding protein [Candidatus Shapirobacteria bacterium]MDD4410399.1 PBP1A family penicillin-binding protein [Candidatus Shapirobacteria bacterium]